MASSTLGSGTIAGWNRRSSAASFSIYWRYSEMVVAPMTWYVKNVTREQQKREFVSFFAVKSCLFFSRSCRENLFAVKSCLFFCGNVV